ncbi:hypothetical protein Syun_001063 [Stephania yunnanensis]|uniref:Uncharacterized protein n=1 Tax=Stephania yunnanensis TaxID=152371 RepID=A0AAP0Q6R2_9MAGN
MQNNTSRVLKKYGEIVGLSVCVKGCNITHQGYSRNTSSRFGIYEEMKMKVRTTICNFNVSGVGCAPPTVFIIVDEGSALLYYVEHAPPYAISIEHRATTTSSREKAGVQSEQWRSNDRVEAFHWVTHLNMRSNFPKLSYPTRLAPRYPSYNPISPRSLIFHSIISRLTDISLYESEKLYFDYAPSRIIHMSVVSQLLFLKKKFSTFKKLMQGMQVVYRFERGKKFRGFTCILSAQPLRICHYHIERDISGSLDMIGDNGQVHL